MQRESPLTLTEAARARNDLLRGAITMAAYPNYFEFENAFTDATALCEMATPEQAAIFVKGLTMDMRSSVAYDVNTRMLITDIHLLIEIARREYEKRLTNMCQVYESTNFVISQPPPLVVSVPAPQPHAPSPSFQPRVPPPTFQPQPSSVLNTPTPKQPGGGRQQGGPRGDNTYVCSGYNPRGTQQSSQQGGPQGGQQGERQGNRGGLAGTSQGNSTGWTAANTAFTPGEAHVQRMKDRFPSLSLLPNPEAKDSKGRVLTAAMCAQLRYLGKCPVCRFGNHDDVSSDGRNICGFTHQARQEDMPEFGDPVCRHCIGPDKLDPQNAVWLHPAWK